MQRNIARFQPLNSSFLSCERDCETVLRRLFVENHPHSEDLMRLLVISTKDCLTKGKYDEVIKDMTLLKLREQGYIRLEPRLRLPEHEQIKSYIFISFDNFYPSENPEYRDCSVNFDVICHTDYWDIGNMQLRPLKICGYIDGLLNNSRMSGIGTVQFSGCNQLILNEDLAGYSLSYRAVHGIEDRLEDKDERIDALGRN